MPEKMDTVHYAIFVGQLVCPRTKQGRPSLNCSRAQECIVPEIWVQATSYRDAQIRAEELVVTDQIEFCLEGRRYLTKTLDRHPMIMRRADPI